MKSPALALLLAATPAYAADPGAFLSAQFAASQGDLTLAAAKMDQALAGDPSSVELQGSAFLLAVLADSPDAVELARSLPGNQAAQLLLADQKAAAGDWPGAELGYAELDHKSFADALRPLLVAWAQQAQGLPDRAMDTLQPALASGHLTGIYLLHAALIADAAHRDGLAQRLYADLAKAQSAPNLQFGQIYAAWQARTGDMKGATATIEAVVRATPELEISRGALLAALAHPAPPEALGGIASAYVAVAAALRQENAPDLAEMLTSLALRLKPNLTDARLLASELALAQKHTDQAAATLAEVPPADPLYPVVQLRLANLDERLGRHKEAEHILLAVADAHPHRPEPLAQLGDTFSDEKRYPDAIAAYDRAIAMIPRPGPSDWGLFYARGAALERAHEWPRAQADMNRALELSPNQPYVLNFLGYSLADRNEDLAEARSMIERALSAKPNDGAIIDSLGWVSLRQGNTSEALHLLEHAAELEPEDPSITGHLGDAYWDAGRHLEAEDQWRRALVLKPDPDDQSRIEARLKSAGK
jgi:tetratricopeptide (TPR) repeat protein